MTRRPHRRFPNKLDVPPTFIFFQKLVFARKMSVEYISFRKYAKLDDKKAGWGFYKSLSTEMTLIFQ